MISFEDAYSKVLSYARSYGTEEVSLEMANGRILSEAVFADRDFPPFDRATKDGIAINYKGLERGNQFKVSGVIAAGTPIQKLANDHCCFEIMTGAVIPTNSDTVVMYEDIEILEGVATLHKTPQKGADIHFQGSDKKIGSLVLNKNYRITPAEIGVLASVGKAKVMVKKLPRITVVSTGNELVNVHEVPLPYQIRKSNIYSLFAALSEEGFVPKLLHISDDKEIIQGELLKVLKESDVLLLSGGVSKGKYDFVPDALNAVGVKKVFHGVLQQPGKPFWFGIQESTQKIVFSFPGNPVSTFVNYHQYFKSWLYACLELTIPEFTVILNEERQILGSLSKFFRVKTTINEGKLTAFFVHENGSGDLTSLAESDGFIRLIPRKKPYLKGESVPFIPTKRII